MTIINKILTKYADDVDATIKNLLTDIPEEINLIIQYHFGWVDQEFTPTTSGRGKMFRPTINLLVFDAITGDHKAALPVAAAIEIIHNFSLLHDDIEDNDRERRGRPTAWTIWGQPRVINAGDFLYSLAYKSLYELENTFPTDRIFAVSRLINEACLALTAGQDLDLRFETLDDVSTKMYVDMVYKKTGALINAAILGGAKLATSDKTIIENYGQFARNIGIAFQIQDDILGIWGDRTKTGKSTDNDLRRKKKTLPVIYMIDQATGTRKEELERLYATLDPLSGDEISFVRESLAETQAQAYAKQEADTYRQNAFDALDRLQIDNQAQIELETIAKFLVDRSH
ncbi:MAG: polyprenyl synthetase family protein [Chloroflexota bacterium]